MNDGSGPVSGRELFKLATGALMTYGVEWFYNPIDKTVNYYVGGVLEAYFRCETETTVWLGGVSSKAQDAVIQAHAALYYAFVYRELT